MEPLRKRLYRSFLYNLKVAIVIILGIACFYFIRGLIDNLYDNKLHHLPCWLLPSAQEVQAVKAAHADTIARIKAIHPGYIGFELDMGTCPGKGFFVIDYPTHRERLEIEQIIGGNRFFGIPYNMIND